jgi:hypothetical protein
MRQLRASTPAPPDSCERHGQLQPQDQLTRDDVLDNITLYWLTNTGISSGRLCWENKFPFFDFKNVSIPVAVSVFPGELYQAPRSWAERAHPKLIPSGYLTPFSHAQVIVQ